MDFMKSVEYKIFIRCRIPELENKLESEHHDKNPNLIDQ
jgi:hypothetical protein